MKVKDKKEKTNMSHMSTSLVTVDCFFSVHESPVYNRMSEISYWVRCIVDEDNWEDKDRQPPTVKLNHYCFELTGLTFLCPFLRKWKRPVFQRDIKAVVFMFECENTGLVDHCRPKGNVSFLLTFRKTATVQKSMIHHSWMDWWCLRGWLLFLSNLRTFVEKRSVQAIAE